MVRVEELTNSGVSSLSIDGHVDIGISSSVPVVTENHGNLVLVNCKNINGSDKRWLGKLNLSLQPNGFSLGRFAYLAELVLLV